MPESIVGEVSSSAEIAFRPRYVWPAKAFPFRLYYSSDNIRIFIIENIQHNFEWMKIYCNKFRRNDRFMVVVGTHCHDWLMQEATEMLAYLGIEKDRFVILFNDVRDEIVFRRHGFTGTLINHNAWLDESLVMKPLNVKKQYDAIYVGRFAAFKRHELATEVPNLALVAGNVHGAKAALTIPPHVFINSKSLTQEEVCIKINESACGLILSAREGACFASSEYLLCGVPVVSTKSEGGRDIWYNDYNSIIVDDDPSAVREAVAFFRENPRDPHKIREAHLRQAKVYRYRFIEETQRLVDQAGDYINMSVYFLHNFFHKMRTSSAPDFPSIFP